jgi:hypothetical protein
MDKAQKSLVDTYFRKRKISTAGNGFEEEDEHELLYLLRTNAIDPSTIKAGNFIFVLQNYPQIIDRLNLETLKINTYFLGYILAFMPQFFDKLDQRLNLKYVLTDSDIEELEKKNPSSAAKLNLRSLAGDELFDVLNNNGENFSVLIPNLSTLSKEQIGALLQKYPYAKKYFADPSLRNHPYFTNQQQ